MKTTSIIALGAALLMSAGSFAFAGTTPNTPAKGAAQGATAKPAQTKVKKARKARKHVRKHAATAPAAK